VPDARCGRRGGARKCDGCSSRLHTRKTRVRSALRPAIHRWAGVLGAGDGGQGLLVPGDTGPHSRPVTQHYYAREHVCCLRRPAAPATRPAAGWPCQQCAHRCPARSQAGGSGALPAPRAHWSEGRRRHTPVGCAAPPPAHPGTRAADPHQPIHTSRCHAGTTHPGAAPPLLPQQATPASQLRAWWRAHARHRQGPRPPRLNLPPRIHLGCLQQRLVSPTGGTCR